MIKNLPNILKFLLLFMAVYLVLTLLPSIKPVKTAAVSIFNTFQQATFNTFHPTARTRFTLFDGPESEYDYSINIYTKSNWRTSPNKANIRPSFILNQNARLTAFGPFIMLIALILASPITWRRKIIALIIGCFLIYILLALKFSAMIDQNAPILRPKGFSLWVSLSRLFNNAFRTQEFLALLIIPIWAISSLRVRDWKWFLS